MLERVLGLRQQLPQIDANFSWQLKWLERFQLLYVFAREEKSACLTTDEWLNLVLAFGVALAQLSQAIQVDSLQVQWTSESIEKAGVPIVNNHRLVALVRVAAPSTMPSPTPTSCRFLVHPTVDKMAASNFVSVQTVFPRVEELPGLLSKAVELAATLDWFAGRCNS
jgi:hypothetical protein